jgi:GNAT superfamily N-acetyltransferase
MASSDSIAADESPLAEAELADAEALVATVGWNQTAADWRTFLALGKVHAVRASTGRVIATAATMPYGGRFAWISLVLVDPAWRRRGLASRLLRRCIDDLTAASLVPVLDATPDGRAVYRGLGFMEGWSYQRMARNAGGPIVPVDCPPAIDIGAITNDVWPSLCAYDAAAFGADRSGLLARLRSRAPDTALVARRDGRVVGLLLGREGSLARQIGPIVADNEDIALALLARALAVVEEPAFVDVADTRGRMLAFLAANGFAYQRPLTRMMHRRATAFDDGVRTFAVAGPEYG